MKQCIVCIKEEAKYKCPVCYEFYCSVICCKIHKGSKCTAYKEEQVKEEENEPMYITRDTIPLDKLKILDTDPEVKKLLSNPHLRTFLNEVDNAKNPDEVMQKAMLEPLFVEFADACLRIVEPSNEETEMYNKIT